MIGRRSTWHGALIAVLVGAPSCGGASDTADGEDAAAEDGEGSEEAGADTGEPVDCADAPYCDPALWLCRPDLDESLCDEPLTATELHADGTTTVHDVFAAAPSAPQVDCFYVYPTVALGGDPGNVEDFSNLADIQVPVRAQAVPFRGVCNLYVPLYHQITLPTYLGGQAEEFLEEAYLDIEAAFALYWDHYNRGHDLVLLGHSQGAHMIRRLLEREFVGDPERMDRLVVAMPIGAVGDMTVAQGELAGGTFASLPLCTGRDERGCVLAFDSHELGSSTAAAVDAPAGMDAACTDPAALLGASARLRGSYFPTSAYQGPFGLGEDDGLDTHFVLLRDFFTGRCARNDAGFSYYEIEASPMPGDERQNPIPFDDPIFLLAGLHVLDYSFPLEELLALVEAKIDAG